MIVVKSIVKKQDVTRRNSTFQMGYDNEGDVLF